MALLLVSVFGMFFTVCGVGCAILVVIMFYTQRINVLLIFLGCHRIEKKLRYYIANGKERAI